MKENWQLYFLAPHSTSKTSTKWWPSLHLIDRAQISYTVFWYHEATFWDINTLYFLEKVFFDPPYYICIIACLPGVQEISTLNSFCIYFLISGGTIVNGISPYLFIIKGQNTCTKAGCIHTAALFSALQKVLQMDITTFLVPAAGSHSDGRRPYRPEQSACGPPLARLQLLTHQSFFLLQITLWPLRNVTRRNLWLELGEWEVNELIAFRLVHTHPPLSWISPLDFFM